MIKLGDEVRDKISGFQGIAVARHTYIEGCNRISIQPPIDKEGKLPESIAFDEPCLEIITIQKISKRQESSATGGPEKWADNRSFFKFPSRGA